MKHLYESPDGLKHLCEGCQFITNDIDTYVVWTKCGIDVTENKSFKSEEGATCPKCLNAAEMRNE